MSEQQRIVAPCVLCDAVESDAPDAFMIFEDGLWIGQTVPGVGGFVIQARRHVEGIWNLTADEAEQFGPALSRFGTAIQAVTGAERLYMVSMGELMPHFHFQVLPRTTGVPVSERGLGFIAAHSVGGPKAMSNEVFVGDGTLEAIRSRLLDS